MIDTNAVEVTPELVEKLSTKAARLAAPVFVANGWEWGAIWAGDGEIPDEAALKETVGYLIDQAVKAADESEDGTSVVSTGRFVVTYSKGEWGDLSVALELASPWDDD